MLTGFGPFLSAIEHTHFDYLCQPESFSAVAHVLLPWIQFAAPRHTSVAALAILGQIGGGWTPTS